MSPTIRAALAQKFHERVKRARELIAYMEMSGIEIGWEKGYTTFKPAPPATPQRLIEEATILSAEIRAIKEGRIKFV